MAFEDGSGAMYELFPDLAGRRGDNAGKLSGGQRQMLALARALMLDPTVLLLDEPSAGLSPKMVHSIFERIRAINEGGTAILLVEQNAREALSVCERACAAGRECVPQPHNSGEPGNGSVRPARWRSRPAGRNV